MPGYKYDRFASVNAFEAESADGEYLAVRFSTTHTTDRDTGQTILVSTMASIFHVGDQFLQHIATIDTNPARNGTDFRTLFCDTHDSCSVTLAPTWRNAISQAADEWQMYLIDNNAIVRKD